MSCASSTCPMVRTLGSENTRQRLDHIHRAVKASVSSALAPCFKHLQSYKVLAGGPTSNGAAQRVAPFLAMAIVVALAVVVVVDSISQPPGQGLADLEVYRDAVRSQIDYGGLYEYKRVNGDTFNYPPIAGLFLIPVALLPWLISAVIWQVSTVLVVAAVTCKISAQRFHKVGSMKLSIALCALLFTAPVQSNLRFGQVSIFVVAAVLVDLLRRPTRTSGMLIGIAAAVKLTPLLFIPFLFVSGRRRHALRAAVVFSLAQLVGLMIWPAASAEYWRSHVWSGDNIPHVWFNGNQSLKAIMSRGGFQGAGLDAAWMALAGIVILISLARARQMVLTGERFTGVVVVGCATIVASPVSWTHHQVLLLLLPAVRVSTKASRNAAWMVGILILMSVKLGNVAGFIGANGSLLFAVNNVRGLLAIGAALLLRPVPKDRQAALRVNSDVSTTALAGSPPLA